MCICMCICMHVYMYLHIHVHKHVLYTYTQIHVYIDAILIPHWLKLQASHRMLTSRLVLEVLQPESSVSL